MTSLYQVLSHPIFLSGLFSWFSAQFIKAIIQVIRRDPTKKDHLIVTLFWTTGGMPSSHSSVVAALTTSVGLVEGFDSSLFVFALFFAFLTVRDALGVRRSTGLQASAINRMANKLKEKSNIALPPVKEVHGHTVPEVTVGILLGIFTAIAFCRL